MVRNKQSFWYLVRNERGFTYPLTICLILLTFVLLTIQLEQYLAEKRFFKESEIIMKQEYYFLSAMKQTEVLLFEWDYDDSFSGVFTFSGGQVEYSALKLTDSLFKVTFTLKMGGDLELTSFGYYDIDAGKVIKWNEKNDWG
ncbi:hypothetical protein BGM26_10250 [Bacillus sp. FJAT-29790]|uniref:competence type IV pilus minor pilin ComGG n=1 Tax=Bacillus sp. FJAT-29790 TaxID=1895002 RepID=UPI001C21BD03|nr:competence type IV pilus minor pilin ComGG [Bacillus sp. FJAT-29790]MBU8879364.1 hypothetical protein [Bacillus sp. FJAT-29790]